MSVLRCVHDGCDRYYPNNKWASIKAHSEGWFVHKDETDIYCPDHLPTWVPQWRDKQARERGFLSAAHEELLTRSTQFERQDDD